MTALTYQKDARAYRFSLPNEIWGLKLPPPAFSILAYLCYLNSHHKGDAVPSVDEIAALLHMSPDMAEKQLDTLVKRNLISPQMVPVFSRKHTGKFFSLPNEIFSLDLGHGAITVYAYLLYCEDRSSHQCHPSYNTISATVGLAVNTVMKHIAKLEDRQFITVEHTSYFDRQGMKWNGNNCYTILPIQEAVDHSYERQMVKLEEVTERQRVAEELQKQGRVRPCEPLCGFAGTRESKDSDPGVLERFWPAFRCAESGAGEKHWRFSAPVPITAARSADCRKGLQGLGNGADYRTPKVL